MVADSSVALSVVMIIAVGQAVFAVAAVPSSKSITL